jgi:hypothetical protein
MADPQTPAFKLYGDRYFVTRKGFDAFVDAASDKIAEALARVIKLEAEVKELKAAAQRESGEVLEWPIKSKSAA